MRTHRHCSRLAANTNVACFYEWLCVSWLLNGCFCCFFFRNIHTISHLRTEVTTAVCENLPSNLHTDAQTHTHTLFILTAALTAQPSGSRLKPRRRVMHKCDRVCHSVRPQANAHGWLLSCTFYIVCLRKKIMNNKMKKTEICMKVKKRSIATFPKSRNILN